ncbi:MAG TPA: hypothetical protein VHT68_11850 [Pseudolabrys sp.]|jgi:hypothetical protein|nr:hypothetical protein [Pseudolabrys sp.]
MKTIGVVVLMLLLTAFLILLIPAPDKPTPPRSTATTSVTTIVIPPSVKLSSLDSSYGAVRGNLSLSNPNNFAIAETEVVCDVIAASGIVIDHYRFTVSEIIPANGTKTMNRYQFGPWPRQAKGLQCNGNKAVKR